MHAPVKEGKSGEEKHSEKQKVLVDMMQNVVPHLVAHHRLNLFRSAAIQEIVIQDDALRAKKSTDVSAHPIGLFRRIDLVNFSDWDAVCSGQTQNRILDLGIFKFLERIE